MLQNAVDMDIIDVTAKVLYKDNEPQIIGASKMKKSNSYIADQTTQMKLILWENNIEEVNVEEVYTFKQVRLCRDGQMAVLNTTPYELHSAAAALRQFTFLVAQRLTVAKAVLVSRSSSQPKISYTAKALQNFTRVKHR